MITVKRAREILGKKYDKYRDKEIQSIVDHLAVLADIAIDQALTEYSKKKNK